MQDIILGAQNLPLGVPLLNRGQLRDTMADIAFQFGDYEDRLADLRLAGSQDLLSQIKQFRHLHDDIARAFATPTRAHYTTLARNSRVFAQQLTRSVGHYLAEVDALEEALVQLHDGSLNFSADLWVVPWDPDVRALHVLNIAGAWVTALYADVPRWDHLREVRRILEGLRVAGLHLEVHKTLSYLQNIIVESSSRFPDRTSQASAWMYEETVNRLIDQAAKYWDVGKR
ncbi:hypothetical protein B0H19DRAFT_1085240 [Mycena capillaripes]|nr:hypothetical protein B0H19DRAFT_1085240 [Mycena capillaripes]